MFDTLLVGFDTGTEIVFALVDFPLPSSATSIDALDLVCLLGSSPVAITFKNFFVADTQIVDRGLKKRTPVPRSTEYLAPEIGVAKSSLARIEALVTGSQHPRHKFISDHLCKLRERLEEFDRRRAADLAIEALAPMRDEVNRDAVRLYAIALGANALRSDSPIARLQNELLLMDAVIQSPATFEAKIRSICADTLK